MAKSKTYSKTCSAVGGYSYAGNFKLYVKLEETSVSTSANTSKVKYTVYCEADGSGSISAKHLKYFKINGEEIINKTVSVSASSPDAYISIASGTTDAISHNSDGSKSISVSAKIEASSYGVKASISETFALTDIARYFTETPAISKNSKTSTTYTWNWSTSETCSKVEVYVDGTKKNTWTGSAKSGTIQATGLSPSTQYDVYLKCTRSDSGLTSNSATKQYQTAPKTIPTLSLSSKTTSSITVSSSCNVTVGSTQYRIKKSGGSYGSWQTSGSFTGLAANTTYVIQVYKTNSETGEGGYAELSVTTYAKTVPTISLSSKTVNSITVSSGCNVSVSSTKYRIKTASGSYGAYQTSATFSGLSPNTSYVIEVYKVGSASGESGTATLSVTTYDIARLTSYPNFNLGDSVTMKYTNPSGASANIGIYSEDSQTAYAGYRACSNGTYTFNFTDTELDTMYKRMNGNTLKAKVYVNINNNAYRESKDITITLTGNQKTGRLNVGGTWKRTKKWININGTWRRCVRWININGTWKRCI